MFRRVFVALLAGCLCLSLLPSCGKKSSSADTSSSASAPGKKILQFGNGAEPQDLDPQAVTGVPESRLHIAFFEGLVTQDPQLNVRPAVAERWDISPDGLVYTFHLRADAKWSNGDPLTADDFVQSYQRMLTPSLAAEYAYMLWHVVGAEDFSKGKLTDFAQTGFKALDPRTLQLTLRQRIPFLLASLNHHAWYPVPTKVIAKFHGLDRKATAWTRPENFVGNGPYVLKEWRPNQKIVAVRSPTYWDRAQVKLDEIHFHPIDLADTEERMFRSGQLDVTYEVPLSKIPLYQRERPDQIHIDPYCGVYFYRFNVQRKPFDDVRVRRALTLAVDREAIAKNLMTGGEKPAYSLVPPDTAGYTSRHATKFDVAEAKRLLAEAGYPEGRGLPPIELLYNTLEKHRVIAEALQQMWRQNLGVEVTLFNQEWKVYLDALNSENYQLSRGGWIADYVDPHVFLDIWQTGSGNNHTHWSNADYDRLLRAALDAPDDKARYEIYQQMEKILLDELPALPIYYYTQPRLIKPGVKWFTTPVDNHPWKYADIR